MAYERTGTNTDTKTVLGDNLDAFIGSTMKLYQQQLEIRNANDEASFYKSVADNNLSLEDQLTYRKEQLKRVSDDPAEKRRITQEVTALKTRVTQQKFLDEFTDKVVAANSGVASIDTVIHWLEDQRQSATDPSVRASIAQSLQTWNDKKFTETQNLLNAQTNFALQDKSGDVLQTQITRVSGAKAAAILAGNTELAGAYDLQLQQLNKAVTINAIQKDMNNFAVSTITGSQSATGLLDAYNSKITSADANTPININGTSFANAQEYWKFVRDSYIADSSGSGLFARMGDELTTAVKVKNSNNTLSSGDVAQASSIYNSLYGRPELANFTAKIDAAKADTLQTAANFLSDKIADNYTQTLDLNKAVTDLNALKSQGVNVDNSMNKILNAATTLKSNNIEQIVSTAQTLMASSPGLSISDAVMQAIQKGAGVVLSPNQLLNTSPDAAASAVLTASEKGLNTPDQSTTITPGNQPLTGLPQPNPIAGTPAASTPGASGAGGNYLIKTGDSLSAIAAKHNTTVAALQAANNITDPNKIQAGATLKIPSAAAPTSNPSAPAPAPIQQPSYNVPQPPKPVVPAAQPANPTPNPQSPSAAANTYVIKSGDYLGKIAAANGTTVAALTKLNNILDPNKIQAGATIKLR